MWSRIAALPRAARLHVTVKRARRSEARSLALAGDQACGSPELGATPEIARALAGASPLRERRDAARRAAAASLDQDRADWADASPSLKVLILARGLLARAVLRAQRRRIERELVPLLEQIGAHAVAAPSIAARLPEPALAEVERQRARAEAASAERGSSCWLPSGGARCLPPSPPRRGRRPASPSGSGRSSARGSCRASPGSPAWSPGGGSRTRSPRRAGTHSPSGSACARAGRGW